MSLSSSRLLALTGALWILLLIIGNDVLGQSDAAPMPSDGPQVFADYYAQHNGGRAWAGVAVELAGFAAGMVFIATIASRIRSIEVVSQLVLVAGTMALAVKLGSGAMLLTVLYRADDGLSPEFIRALSDLSSVGFVVTFLPQAVFAAAAAIGLRRANAVAPWVSWSGIGAAVALVAGMPFAMEGPGFIGMLLLLVWVIACSVNLALRSGDSQEKLSSKAPVISQVA